MLKFHIKQLYPMANPSINIKIVCNQYFSEFEMSHLSSEDVAFFQVQKIQQIAPFAKLSGKFYLIDLAGSEDNRRTGNEGLRYKTTSC